MQLGALCWLTGATLLVLQWAVVHPLARSAVHKHPRYGTHTVSFATMNLAMGGGKWTDASLRMAKSLSDPELVFAQHVRYGDNAASDVEQLVLGMFHEDYDVLIEPAGCASPSALIWDTSTYSLTDEGSLDLGGECGSVYARLRMEDVRDGLLAVSVRLSRDESERVGQAERLIAFLTQYYGVEKLAGTTPEYLVVAGSFNFDNVDTDPAAALFREAGLSPGKQLPCDQDQDPTTDAARSAVHDLIFTNFEAKSVPYSLVHPHASGLVFDTRRFEPLDSAPPAQPGDAASDGLRHLPVVRSFQFALDDAD